MSDETPVATRQLLLEGELLLLRDKWRQKVGQLNGTPPYWQETLDALQSTFNPPLDITAEQVAEEQRAILQAAKERWDVG